MAARHPISLAFSVIILFSISIFYAACKKEIREEPQPFHVYLTDDPARFDAVNIDIIKVEVKVDTSSAHMQDDHHGDMDGHADDHMHTRDEFGVWVPLSFTPGIYDVLQLRNGIDSLIASTVINGTARKIRFTLGSNNTVVDSGVTYPLILQNPYDSFLYVSLNDRHRYHHHTGATSVWVDFDLGRSIIKINGQYYLRPQLRPFCDENFGEIEGRVLPAAASATVMAYNNTDTAFAFPNHDGYFIIRGLNPGDYSVLFDGVAPYHDTTINMVTLNTGRAILNTVTLHP